jgi:hypothetical protein
LSYRVGSGFDVHAFGPGEGVMLGGVKVPWKGGVIAHSDGDVLLHALTDALLGAGGLGDIGQHFPDSDARWRGGGRSKGSVPVSRCGRRRRASPRIAPTSAAASPPRWECRNRQ